MNTELKYMPILRVRQMEESVLRQFYFGKHIYPCVEIVDDGQPAPPVEDKKTRGKRKLSKKTKINTQTFEQIYANILWKINCEKVFVDLPIHFKPGPSTREEVVKFNKSVIVNREKRTEHLLKFRHLSTKIIPVISTYAQINNEYDTIVLQERDLRSAFNILAYRTLPLTFDNDFKQIVSVAQPQDFLIVDLDDYVADPKDDDIKSITEKLRNFTNCHVIIVKAAMDHNLTNIGLEPGESVYEADNRLLKYFKGLHGHSFGDYGGIKKDKLDDGRGRSPGFIIYNPLENNYYGYRGTLNDKGKSNEDLDDFANIIVPSFMSSSILSDMKSAQLGFISANNRGWQMLDRIHKKIDKHSRSGSKFKRIAMEHYLHCIRTKIDAGDFN